MQSGNDRPRSPLLATTHAVAIPSPHHINQVLLEAAPAEQRSQLARTIFNARLFAPTDHRGFMGDPSAFGLTVAVSAIAGLRVSASLLQRGMSMAVVDPGAGSYTLGFRRSGTILLRIPGQAETVLSSPATGLIYRERSGMHVVTSDDHVGLAIEISASRMVHVLAHLIERPVTREIVFEPTIRLDTPQGAHILRTVSYIESELCAPGGLIALPTIAPTIEDLLIRTLLIAQPHNHTTLLEREARPASSLHVRRAQDFMAAHATEALTLDQIAAAAGCSARTLQVTFRQVVGRSPMEDLRCLRLEQARRLLQSHATSRVIDVAEQFRFSSPGRFARYYKASYGHAPSRAADFR